MLLLAGMDDESARLAGIDPRAGHARAADLDDAEKRLLEGNPVEASLVGPAIGDPLAAVRRLKARAAEIPFLILASPDRCARVEHHLLLTALPGAVELIVADEGHGIPAGLQPRLFEAFLTTKPHGTGLGLSIVQRLVDLHGGRIRFDTAPGRGTTFTVSFPAAG